MRVVARAVERKVAAQSGKHLRHLLRQAVVPVERLALHTLSDQDFVGRKVVTAPVEIVIEDVGEYLLFRLRVFRLGP